MMDSAVIMRNILFSLSGLSLGASLFAIGVHTSRLKRDWKRHSVYIMAKLGYFLVAGEVLKEILIVVPGIPVTPDAIVYAVGLTFASIGFFGVAMDARQFDIEDRRDQTS